MHQQTPQNLLLSGHPLSNGNIPKFKPAVDLQGKVTYLYEHQLITDLLNEYAYRLDSFMDSSGGDAQKSWEQLFTENCEVRYPFGMHHGREGLGKWAFAAESRFQRMQHLSSNFKIVFESEAKAAARSALIAVCGLDTCDISKNFSEGGYYYWDFRKVDDEWKIERLFLDVVWTQGDSLGLNDRMES